MEQVTVMVGSITTGNSGLTRDTTRDVNFTGERLGEYRQPGMHKGTISDSRGTIKTLYRTEDGRLIVHIQNWTRWVGEATSYTLHTVTLAELVKEYPFLADACGLGQPLTLDQALSVEDQLEAAWATRAADSD